MIKIVRTFTGTLITGENYQEILEKEGRKGINFHNRMLKAYKRGDNLFAYGKYIDGRTQYHKCPEKIEEINLES